MWESVKGLKKELKDGVCGDCLAAQSYEGVQLDVAGRWALVQAPPFSPPLLSLGDEVAQEED